MSEEKDNRSNQPEQNPKSQTSEGLFIIKGMSISIPSGGFTLRASPEGILEDVNLTLHVGLDMCPYWLRIAYQHLLMAEVHNNSLHLALVNSNDEEIGLQLENEFLAAIQVFTASAIAIDAFYAMVKERIDIPQTMLDAWKNKGTARESQIGETIRRAFAIGNESHKNIQDVLDQIMGFRNRAVHPSAKLQSAIYYPELSRSTEWRFIAYRFENAKPAVSATLSIIAQLAKLPKEKYSKLKTYCEALERAVLPLVEEWEKKYGLLYPRNEAADSEKME